jgi:hypothetical protein
MLSSLGELFTGFIGVSCMRLLGSHTVIIALTPIDHLPFPRKGPLKSVAKNNNRRTTRNILAR